MSNANSVQLSVDPAPGVPLPGMLGDSSGAKDVVSCIAAVDLPAGSFVTIIDGVATLPAVTTDVSAGDVGVVLSSHENPTQCGWKAKDVVPVLRVGRVWMYSETAMTGGALPFIRFTANTGPTRPVGEALNGADTAKAVQRPGVRCVRGTAAAGPVLVQLSGDVGT